MNTVYIVTFSEQGMGSTILGVAATEQQARGIVKTYLDDQGADWQMDTARAWNCCGDQVRIDPHSVVGAPTCPVRFLRERIKDHRTVLHSVRVAQTFPAGSPLRTAGYLHDVVEDGGATLAEVRELFGLEVADIVEGVTRREGEVYRDFIHRAASSEGSRVVKVADVTDNLTDMPAGNSLCQRYQRALVMLTAKI